MAFRGKLVFIPVATLALIFGAGLPQAASPATGASANAPVAANDSATTAEDTAVDVNVLANDTDDDDDALAISAFTQGANGAVTLVAGKLRYTPLANFNGSDSFTYRANDGTADSNVATVTVTVTEVNDLPVPLPDSKATAEDTMLSFPATDVLVNDSPGPANEAGQTLTVVSVSNGPGGAVSLSAGTIRFTPSPNYNGPASFNYRVRDNGTTNGVPAPKEWTSKVNVTVSAVNDAPVAVNDAYTATEDTPLAVAAPGVIGNDTDVDSPTTTASKVGEPTLGAVTLDANGSFTYTPAPNLNGSDSFTYRANDGTADSNVATVTLAIAEVNDAPIANADTKATAEDTALTFPATQLSTNDSKGANEAGQTLTVTAVGGALNGTVDLVGGSVTFTPSPDFNGVASFSYTVTDDGTTSGAADPQLGTGEVTVEVSEVNDVPSAAADTLTAIEDTALSFPAAGLLANDAAGPPNEAGQSLSVTAVGSPVGGTVSLDAGTVTFTPSPDFAGTGGFSYTIRDDGVTSGAADPEEATGTVTVDVGGVNDGPVAHDDAVTTPEDTTLNASVPAATDPEVDTIAYTLVAGLAGLSFNADGSYTYVPAADVHGTVSITYRANDGKVDSNVATVTITVSEVNDAPSAAADAMATPEDTAGSFPAAELLANDSPGPANESGQSLTVSSVQGAVNGTVTLVDGTIRFTPSADANGAAAFSYTVTDNGTPDPESDSGEVSVSVSEVNDAPTPAADTKTVAEDTALSFPAVDLLGNDAAGPPNEGGQSLAVLAVGSPADGTVSLNAGTVTFTPAADFNGSARFNYTIRDDGTTNGLADAREATGTVNVTVSGVNDAPVARDDTKTTAEDTTLNAVVPAAGEPDGDTVTYALVTDVAGLTFDLDGNYAYDPPSNFHGTVSFTYKANDGTLDSNTATVTITVTPVNDQPVAVADAYETAEDTPLSVPAPGVLENDNDIEASPLNAVLEFGPGHGTLPLNANGSLSYTPAANFHGSDTFTYRASDGSLGSNVATVTVTVTPVNDAPVAQDGAESTAEDTVLSTSVPAASDVDGDAVSYALVAGLPGLSFRADGSYTYAPPSDFHGTVSFTYEASDGTLDSNVATVTITVTAVNDPPVAADDAYAVAEDGSVTIAAPGLLANDSDVDSASLTASNGGEPRNGAVTVNANGSFTYTPDPNFNGSDAFTYRAGDGALQSNVATVVITVSEVNDVPVANDDTKATSEDTALSFPASELAANDSPGAGNEAAQALSVISVQGAVHGTVSLLAGSVTFTPSADFNGAASFSYTVRDDGATDGAADPKEATGTVTVSVSEVNDAPSAVDDTRATAEDAALSFPASELVANDGKGPANEDGQSLSVSAVSGAVNGTVSLAAGTITFTPSLDFSGDASFSYTVEDDGSTNGITDAKSDAGQVSVAVSEVNDKPTAAMDTKATAEDTPLTFPASELLGNDTAGPPNEADQTLSAIAVGSAIGGTVSLVGGTITFTPAPDFNGAAGFSYTVRDDGKSDGLDDPKQATGTVSVSVSAVNDAPLAGDDAGTTAEDTALTLAASELTSNDAAGPANEAGQSLSVISVQDAVNGTVSLVAGTVTFAPSADFTGAASFTYTVSDDGTSNGVADPKEASGTVTVAVSAVNDAPRTLDDAQVTAEDTPLSFPAADLTGNDSEGPANEAGQTLNVTGVGGALNGTVSLAAGVVTFTPGPDFNGAASFTYSVADDGTTDGAADPRSDSGLVTVAVSEVNDAPVPAADTRGTAEDTVLSFPAVDLLANDSPGAANESGQSLTVLSVQEVVNGTVSLVAGTVTFTPAANHTGEASFTYTLRDDGTSNGTADPREAAGTVTVNVSEVNDAPSAIDDAKGAAEDTPLSFPASELVANDGKGPANEDGQSLSVSAVGGGVNGTVSLIDGRITFTPSPDFNGNASFSYTVTDDGTTNGLADPEADGGQVSVSVREVNDAPSAAADTKATLEDTSLSFPATELAANDATGPPNEGDQRLNVTSVHSPVNGTVALAGGTVTFTPSPDFNGAGNFSYTVRDDGASDGAADTKETVGTVNVTVSAANDAPIAVDDLQATAEDTTLSFPAAELVSDDSKGSADESGQSLTVTSVQGAVNGTVSLAAGTITFTPNPDFNGAASFSYTATDDGTTNGVADPKSDSGQVTVSVSEVNDPPRAAADAKATPEDTPLSFPASELLGNDAAGPPNEAGQRVSLISVGSAVSGTVSLVDSTVTFVPSADFNGAASFAYTIRDDGTSDGLADAKSVSGIVEVTVAGVNDAPVAHDRAETTDENTTLSSSVPTASDVDGDALAYALVTGLPGLSFEADGSYAYVPPANFSGTVSFTYKASDGTLDSNVATVTITVGAVNDAPVAVDDRYAVAEDGTLTIASPGVLGNDRDSDSVSLTATLVATTTNGTLGLAANGSFSYVPDANFHGSDSFTYKVSDGSLDSNLATVTITISEVNDGPTAAADSKATAEDTALSFPAADLAANDSVGPASESGQSLTVSAVGSPVGGTVTLAAGAVTFSPTPDFNGHASFTYTVTDDGTSNGLADPREATGTVTVAVSERNDAPTAAADTQATPEDTPLSFPAVDLLANDAAGPPNEAGQVLSVVSVHSPVNGTVSLAAGSVTFTPAANFDGTATFGYTLRDEGTSDGLADPKQASGTVSVAVSAVNDAPVAHDDAETTDEDTTLHASLPAGTDVDGDALTYTLLAGPLGLSLGAEGGYTYVPPSNFSGSVSFTYRASDGALESNVATVTITVDPVNDAPLAGADAYALAEDASLTIAAPGLLANDGDVDSAGLTAVKVGNPANGTVSVSANGSFSYTPSADFHGADTFTYKVSDGALDSNVATVTLTVSAVNDVPLPGADTKATAEDTPLSFPAADLLANDSLGAANESGQSLSVTTVDSPAGGAVSLAAGTVTFTPAADFNGSASFSYTVRDNGTTDGTPDAKEASATVTVEVSAVNDAPSAFDDLEAAAEDTALSFAASELLGNDGKGAANEGGQSLTVTAVGGAVNGAVSLVDGTVTFIPSPDFNGAATFSYTVSDDGATTGAADSKSDTGQVAVTVSEVNDAPAAVADARAVAEDQSLNLVASTLAANDSPGPANENGQSVAVTAVGGAVNGTVSLSAGAIVFTPNPQFNGLASFTYTVEDNGSTSGGPDPKSAVGIVTVAVAEVNDAPTATADTNATVEDTILSFPAGALAANDSPGPANEGGQTLSVVSVQDAVNGTVSLAGGDITFTPVPDFSGPASFTYSVQDDGTTHVGPDPKSTVGTVTVNVAEVNDAPTAATDAKAMPEDTALSFPAADLLGNDAEGPPNEAGQALSVISVQGAANGTVTLEGGTVTFNPASNFSGAASFGYTIRDDGTSSGAADAKEASGTVNVSVTAVNDAPVAAGNAYTTAEETPLTVSAPGVLANDSDIDSATLSAIAVSEPANGTVTLNANGSFTYTPAAGFSGLDSFTYWASDGALESNLATVTMTVGAVNDAPVAVDDSYTVAEDGSLTIAAPGMLGNDSDSDSVSLTATLVGTTMNGTLTLDADGSFTYSPNANFNGSDSFTYQASDGSLDSNVATVAISVIAVNDAPSAGDDVKATAEDAPISFEADELLTNDATGPANESGQTLAVTAVGGAVNGTVELVAGTVTFTPAPDFNGATGFSYTVADDGTSSGGADAKTDSGTVTVAVSEVNDAPTAATDTKATSEDAPVSFPASELLANDAAGPPNEAAQSLSVLAVGSAVGGTVSLSAGTVTFTPSANYNGPASFAYTVTDDGTSAGLADAKSASGTVNVSVSAVNDAPLARDDAQATAEDTTLHASLPAGTDVDGDALTYALLAGLPGLSLEAGGSYAYVPPSDLHGTVSFTYRASDGALESNVATVTITVSAVDDAPLAADDAYSLAEDATITIAAPGLLANDGDVDSSSLSASKTSDPAHGSVAVNANGSFTYTPHTNYNGADSFTYEASDGALDSNVATVTFSVSSVNDSPAAAADTKTTAEDTALSFPAADLLRNDSAGPANEASQSLSVVSVQGAMNGTVSLALGTVTFTPIPDFNGSASFTYTVADDGTTNGVADARQASGIVNVDVSEVNDPPTPAADARSTAEDTALSFPASELLTNDAAGPPNESGQTLNVISVGSPVNATVTLEGDTISFRPARNYHGPASFAYTIRDNGTSSGTTDAREATGAVNMTVTAVNDAPLAANDSYATAEETPLTIPAPGVLGNDSDVDSASLSAVRVSNPGNGTLTLNANGSFTYTPAVGFSGLDSFSYRASDGTLESNLATVTIDVGAVNDAPVALDDAYSLPEDGGLTIAAPGLLANDADVDSASLSAIKVANPANGTVTVNANGSFTYTPSANFNGTDSFTYKASDGTLDSNVATVTLTVAAIDDTPVAAEDSATTGEDSTIDVDVLANDSDVEGSLLTVASFSQGGNGSVALVAGQLRYTPNANFHGSDSFTYRASDGTLDSDLATVTIAVTAVNDTPSASADSKAMPEDAAVSFPAGDLVANDSPGPADEATQTLTVTSVGGGVNGTVSLASGTVTFTPDPDFNGAASFTYTTQDDGTSSGGADPKSAVGTVTVDISAVNDPPTAAADAKTTAEDAPLSFPAGDLVANDAKGPTNEAGQSLTVVSVQSAANGTVDLTSGTVTFSPAANFSGPASFTYTATDNGTTNGTPDAKSAVGTVTVNVSAVNDAPVARADDYLAVEGTPLTVDAPGVLANDTDVDSPSLSAVKVDNPAHGTVTVSENGSFTYTPTPGFSGSDSFTYTANDGGVNSAVAMVTIVVGAVNDAPAAANDAYGLAEDAALTVDAPGVLGNDSDVDSASLSAIKVSDPANGVVTLNANGSFAYTPNANFNGSDSFTYEASDGSLDSSPATVTLTVSEVNDAPAAATDTRSTAEDTALSFPAAQLLTNDSAGAANEGGQTLSVISVGSPVSGTVSLAGGIVTFTPDPEFKGPAGFTYTVRDNGTSDGAADPKSAVGTVTVDVSEVNDPPTAADDAKATAEDTAVSFPAADLAANDGAGPPNEGSQAPTVISVQGAANGTVDLVGGTVTFTPSANFNGAASFTYTVRDNGTTNGVADAKETTGTVSVSVSPVNDAPAARNNAYETSENTQLTIPAPGVLGNDSDVDSASLTAAKVANPANGSVTLNANGSFTYTPNAGFNGTDTFTYTVTDGTLDSSTATVTITVRAVNDAPVADDGANATAEDTTLNAAVPAASDPDGDSLTYELVDGSPGLTFDANGSFTYLPASNFHGTRSFTYRATDGSLSSNTATITITVTPVNDAPVARDDASQTNERTPVNVNVLANDTDVEGTPLTVASFSQGAHGSVARVDGKLRYTPDAGFSGSDFFTYRAGDGALDSNAATVTIDVGAVDDAPVANDQSFTTAEDTAKTITLTANDVDSGSLSYTVVAGPSHGALSGTAPDLTYTPAANYHGADSFTFKANDGTSDSNLGTVTIAVTPVADAPVAGDRGAATAEDTPRAIVLVATDVDSVSLAYSVVAGPSHGALSGAPPNLTYTPEANYNGPDSFTYRANDGTMNSNVATVTITVTSVNDAPIALGDAYSVDHNGTLTVSAPGLLGNDFDIESGLSAAAVANPSGGTLSLDANGSFTYTPSAGFSGTDTFTYRASDGALDSNVATVTITVAQAPPAPPPPPPPAPPDPPAAPADQQPPTDPIIESTSHKLNVASSDRTIDLTWSGAGDDQSGVDGFSFHWDNQPVSVPDTVKDAEETATGTTSPPLSNGIWYFHLRTRDNAGNWTATRHVAPFVISVPPPAQVRCVVPNLKGKKVAQARGLLAAGRCTLARVTRIPSRLVKAGRIVSQSRPPGARLPRGTRVSLVVSSGPRR